MAVLALDAGAHLAAQVMDDEVQPVANAQHRHSQRKQLWVGCRRVRIVHRRRPAGEDKPQRLQRLDLSDGRGAGQHHGEDILLANAPRDQLRVLRTEIEDDDSLGSHGLSVAGTRAGCKDRTLVNISERLRQNGCRITHRSDLLSWASSRKLVRSCRIFLRLS